MAVGDSQRPAPRRWGDESALFDEDEARRRLLDATGRCIVKAGSARIKIGEVADEAGVSRSTVYRYFASRDDLIVGLMVARTDAAFGRIVAALADPDDARVTIPELVLGPVGLVEGNALNEALFTSESRAVVVSSVGLGGGQTADVSMKHFGPLFGPWQESGQVHTDLDVRETLQWLNATAFTLLSPPWDEMSAPARRAFVDRYVVRALVIDDSTPTRA